MRFPLFIGIVQSILFLGHWFLYRTLVRFLEVTTPAKLLTLKIGVGLLSVSLVLTSLLAFRYSSLWVRCLYTAAASWLGILYLLILASILCWIFYGLARLFHLSLNSKIIDRDPDRNSPGGKPLRVHQCGSDSHHPNEPSTS